MSVNVDNLRYSHMSHPRVYSLRFGIKITALIFSLSLLLLQALIFIFEIPVAESSAAWVSILSAIFLILMASLIDLSSRNWMLWFSIFYFLLYQFGSMVGMIFLEPDKSYLDYGTTFGDGADEHSRVASYFLSGIAASFLAVLSFFFPPKLVHVPGNDKRLERASFFMWAISTPFVLIHYLWLFTAFSADYASSYSAEAKDLKSIVPLSWVFTNVFSIGFYLWLASVPSERSFKKGFYIFILTSLASSLYGGRINFVVPLIFIFWYRSVVYGRELSKFSLYLGGILIFIFVLFVENFRSQVGIDLDVIVGFFIGSLSKAQYTLSLYIDGKSLIDQVGSNYWSAPLTFPYDYFVHGGALVGQGEASADIRGDLGHVMPAALNRDAYIAGAGTGSSLVAEAYQYGLIGLFPLLLMFYFFYREIFRRMSKRIFLMISPLVFMHFVFSGRDSLFLNSWGLVKLILAYCLLRCIIVLWSRLSYNLLWRRRLQPV